ncbi:probable E3 ubiquitin-protein ligase RNF217 [Trichonephila clavipes]|nr:probable E3 ubiquitin-protein ligase RNF217 [Trichonephila clavipes]
MVNFEHFSLSRVACPSCQLEWCFSCHAPAHGVLTCRQYKKGDRLLRNWARARTHGQLNAQKCPNCKVSTATLLTGLSSVQFVTNRR